MSSDSENSDDSSPTKNAKNRSNIPIKTNDLSLSKSSFQQMLMKFNNTAVKNDKRDIKPPVTPAKGILKTPKASRDSMDLHAFNPPASSTQAFLDTSSHIKFENTSNISDSTKKHKKSRESESFDETAPSKTPNKIKKRKREVAREVSESEGTSSFDTTILVEKSKKAKKHKRHKSESDDRISHQVELNTNTQDDYTETSKLDSILEKFKNDNNLTELEDIPGFSKDISSNRYETFLIQTPKSFDPNELVGLELPLISKVRIQCDGIKYDCIPTACEEPATLLNKNELMVVCPKATIVIKQHIKRKDVPETKGTLMNGVAFPNDLKERHPLFGADYSKRILIEQSIRDKLKAAVALNQHRIKKERKVKVLKDDEPSSKSQDEEIFKLLNLGTSEVIGKKPKSKRHKDIDRSAPYSSVNDDINQMLFSKSDHMSSGKKKKHKKRESF